MFELNYIRITEWHSFFQTWWAQYISCNILNSIWFWIKLPLYLKFSFWWVSTGWNLSSKIVFKWLLTKSFSQKKFELILNKKLLLLVTELIAIWSPCCDVNILFLPGWEKFPSHCLITPIFKIFLTYCLLDCQPKYLALVLVYVNLVRENDPNFIPREISQ